jgi:deoxyhypusine synthase
LKQFIKDASLWKIDNEQFASIGFQATQLARAAEIIKEMKKAKARIFFSFTSNMVASGLRGLFAGLCKRKFIDVIVTAGGAIDHDFIRAYSDYEIGDFFMDDVKLHEHGINRIGNILVQNKCYELLEEKVQPLFEKLYVKNKIVSPSELAAEIGRAIGDDKNAKKESSFLYWCAKNNIPVFCPAITDSAIGLQVYFFKQKKKDFGIDATKDMNELAQLVLNAEKTGAIVLGGGVSKHYTIGVNILRGGLDYTVYITTSSPFDGSLSGARTQEALSWGKIARKASHVTVDCDATIAFPLLMKMVFENLGDFSNE